MDTNRFSINSEPIIINIIKKNAHAILYSGIGFMSMSTASTPWNMISPHPSVELRTKRLAKDIKILSKFAILLIQSPPTLRQSHFVTISEVSYRSSIFSVRQEKKRPLKYVVAKIAKRKKNRMAMTKALMICGIALIKESTAIFRPSLREIMRNGRRTRSIRITLIKSIFRLLKMIDIT